MEEQWKPVVSYEGYYEVSDQGRVRSLDRVQRNGRFLKGRVMKQSPYLNGYMNIVLNVRQTPKNNLVHRLVAEAFIGPRPEGLVIDHIDSNRKNNRASNLRYITQRENNSRNKPNKFGLLGVKKGKYGRYRVIKKFGSATFHIGVFDTPEEAHEAHVKATYEFCLLSKHLRQVQRMRR